MTMKAIMDELLKKKIPLKVIIRQADPHTGEMFISRIIVWDGEHFHTDPDVRTDALMKRIMDEPLMSRHAGESEMVTKEQDPVRWLFALSDMYRGGNIHASLPIPIREPGK
jgi:hypothetical protein